MARPQHTLLMTYGKCTADRCDGAATRVKHQLCEKHYARIRRRGRITTEAEDLGIRADLEHSHGYVLQHYPNHPLATRRQKSRMYQHRVRYYDAHGDGPFNCHWCGCQVGWGDMHVDHLNAERADNRIENLVASCPKCNQKRGFEKMRLTHRKRSNARIDWNGKSLCFSEVAEMIGISAQSVRWRVKNGWDAERIMTEPRGVTGPQRMERSYR